MLADTKIKDISLAKTQCASGEPGREDAGLSGFFFSFCQPFWVPGGSLPVLVSPGLVSPTWGMAMGDSGLCLHSACFVQALGSFRLPVLLRFGRLVRAGAGGSVSKEPLLGLLNLFAKLF